MRQETITTGRLSLRPFTMADIPWVQEVSLDPGLRRFVELPSPYGEDARYFVEQVAIAGTARGRRVELLVEDCADGSRLGRMGLGLRGGRRAEIGFWVDPRVRGRGVATEGA